MNITVNFPVLTNLNNRFIIVGTSSNKRQNDARLPLRTSDKCNLFPTIMWAKMIAVFTTINVLIMPFLKRSLNLFTHFDIPYGVHKLHFAAAR
jgi:hypothetical protein